MHFFYSFEQVLPTPTCNQIVLVQLMFVIRVAVIAGSEDGPSVLNGAMESPVSKVTVTGAGNCSM